MRTAIVGGPTSRLYGARCTCCPNPVTTGESVVYHTNPNTSYAEDRLVTHVDCMQALLDRAPTGIPARHKRARAAAIRRSVETTGNPYATIG